MQTATTPARPPPPRAAPPAAFRVERMTASDFSTILRPSHRRGGDLCTAPIPLCWPVASDGDAGAADPRADDDDEALRRLEYSTDQQKAFWDRDASSHFVKAVTVAGGEIVAIARWNFFPRGYDFAAHEPVDVGEFLPPAVLESGRYELELYRAMRTGMMRARKEWHAAGPSWNLMAMTTRECYRRQGAGSMLVEWGVKRAREDGVPAYLEASVNGKPVYEKCGFVQVGEAVPWDCKPYGKDVVFKIAKMAFYPELKVGS